MSRASIAMAELSGLLIVGILLFFSFPIPVGATDEGPTLADGKVSPENGAWGTVFTFLVTFISSENLPPPEGYPKLSLDNKLDGVVMEEKEPTDTDFADGKVYRYKWRTEKGDVGKHTFYFYVPGARDPESENYSLTVARSPTSIEWEVDNPSPASGENVIFSGRLRSDNVGVAGENVFLYEVLASGDLGIDSVKTDENGYFSFSIAPTDSGIFVYETAFLGDNYYEGVVSPPLHVSTLGERLFLNLGIVFLLIIAGIFTFLSRGLKGENYLKPVLMGFLLGFVLLYLLPPIFAIMLAGGISGFLFSKRTKEWTKHLRVGCMSGLLLFVIIPISLFTLSPGDLAYSAGWIDFLYSLTMSLILYVAMAGLAATIGGILRGGAPPRSSQEGRFLAKS